MVKELLVLTKLNGISGVKDHGRTLTRPFDCEDEEDEEEKNKKKKNIPAAC